MRDSNLIFVLILILGLGKNASPADEPKQEEIFIPAKTGSFGSESAMIHWVMTGDELDIVIEIHGSNGGGASYGFKTGVLSGHSSFEGGETLSFVADCKKSKILTLTLKDGDKKRINLFKGADVRVLENGDVIQAPIEWVQIIEAVGERPRLKRKVEKDADIL